MFYITCKSIDRMSEKYIFVTVGTTRFDSLVAAVLSPEFVAACDKHECSRVRVQIGSSSLPDGLKRPELAEETVFSLSAAADGKRSASRPVRFELYTLRPSLADDIAGAAFVVSHAGAGSIFEALRADKGLVVVVNDSLADNHQTELAEAMSKRGYCLSCTPSTVASVIASSSFDRRERLPPAAPGLAAFVAGVDAVCGF